MSLRKAYALGLLAALALYAVSMAPGPLWQDSGMAQIRTLRRDLYGQLGLALSHPLYYCFTIAFQFLPFHESAFKTNLVSVVFGAVTVANVMLLVRLITGRWWGAVVGALSLAVAHTFWQHCALAEVYTLTTALLTTELLCFYQYAVTKRIGWLIALFAFNGLGISNHMLASLSLACYSVYVLTLLVRRGIPASKLPLLALAWTAGAGLYLSMIVLTIANSHGVGETIRSALFGRIYQQGVLNVLPSRRQLLNSAMYLALNFPTPLVLLLIPGVRALFDTDVRAVRRMLAALTVVYLLWAVRYDVPDQYTFFIPSIVLLAILIGLGADRFLEERTAATCCRTAPHAWKYALIAAAVLPAGIYAALPPLARAMHLPIGVTRDIPYRDEYAYFLHPWKTGYRGAERFASELHDLVPDGAVIIADSTTVRPLIYMQLTNRWSKRVQVYPRLTRSEGENNHADPETLRQQLTAGLVYVVTPERPYCPAWLLEGYTFSKEGIVYRVTGRRTATSPTH